MLKIWGRITSINVRKVVLAAQWLGIPFERTDAGLAFGVVGSPGYRAMNPNGLVPTIEDDGLVLWESNVIVRYLCAKHSPGRLYPTSLPERFHAERWMDWQQTSSNPAGRNAFIQLIRTPADQRDMKAVEQSVAAMQPLMAMLDAHLAHQPYVAGEAFTMADIPLACEVHRWLGVPVAHPPLPHLQRWYDAIRSQPAARGVLDLQLS
jgi:glutathione S-transferase